MDQMEKHKMTCQMLQSLQDILSKMSSDFDLCDTPERSRQVVGSLVQAQCHVERALRTAEKPDQAVQAVEAKLDNAISRGGH